MAENALFCHQKQRRLLPTYSCTDRRPNDVPVYVNFDPAANGFGTPTPRKGDILRSKRQLNVTREKAAAAATVSHTHDALVEPVYRPQCVRQHNAARVIIYDT